jgi:hypothetical protein
MAGLRSGLGRRFVTHDWIAGNDNSVAVYVRLQDRSNSMWFQIAAYGAACGFKREGEDTVIHLEEREIGRGDHHLRVEAKGNKYEFLVDGQRICFFEDDTFFPAALASGPRKVGKRTKSGLIISRSRHCRKNPYGATPFTERILPQSTQRTQSFSL